MTAVHVSGGCDGDGSLERGETVDIEVTVRNVGTADAVQTVVTVATSPLSDVPADVVTYDGGARARVDVGRLAPGQFGTARARASLVAREQPFCGRDLSLQIEALADGVAARTFTFSLPTDVDLEGERGRCERAPCTAAPVITAVTPERLVRGTVAAQVVVTGDHFVPGVELRLGADLVPARVERVDATRLVAHDVHVAEGALPGVRNVAVVNPDDQAAVATGALTVALRLEVAAAGRGCGCSATAPGDGVLGTLAALAGAWALRTRRRRAH
jgi:MYXO-CTERM domain-containing protein